MNRWRLFIPSGLFSYCAKNRISFIASETSAKFFSAIRPFQKYTVSTTIHMTDNKWLHYTHRFEKFQEAEAKGDVVPKTLAIIEAKAVMKELNGKTFRLNNLTDIMTPEYYQVFGINKNTTS